MDGSLIHVTYALQYRRSYDVSRCMSLPGVIGFRVHPVDDPGRFTEGIDFTANHPDTG